MPHPCDEGLTAACFAAAPQWAKQAFAVRLMNILVPPSITRRLPRWKFSTHMIFPPGWQPGDPLPAGITINTAVFFPPGWQPGDPLPPGIIAAPGATFPPGWTPGDPLPPGFAIDPSVFFPPGWAPGDDLPPDIIWQPALPPPDTGPTAPIFIDPGAPWIPRPVGRPPKEEFEFTITAETGDGYVVRKHANWPTLIGPGDGTSVEDGSLYTGNVAGYYESYGEYALIRGFVAFDLSGIPAGSDIRSCTIFIHGYNNADGRVSLLKGTWENPLAVGDWDAWEGPALRTLTWEVATPFFSSFNEFNLGWAARQYVESKFGGRVAFVLREYTHDVMALNPGWPPVALENGMIFRNFWNPEGYPYIEITYTL